MSESGDVTNHPWTLAFDFSPARQARLRFTTELKPGMSAMVDFMLPPRQDVLAIPHQAVRTDQGKKLCFVAHDETLERRVVKIGQDTADMVEVLDGLQEGEMVALDPPGVTTNIEQL